LIPLLASGKCFPQEDSSDYLMKPRYENSTTSEGEGASDGQALVQGGTTSEASNVPKAIGQEPFAVLSHIQASALVAARKAGEKVVTVSLDLELSKREVSLSSSGVVYGSEQLISWDDIDQIARSESVCFAISEDGVQAIRAFSEESGKVFQLMPTSAEPLLLIAGFAMHRFRDVGPALGAKKMVEALSPLRGRVLDTTTGLGYAAIQAARFATEVVTIELDPMARQMARQNPWSRELFAHPRIKLLLGDSSEVVGTLPDDSFSAVLHDPPAINLAGELYSQTFYGEVCRVLTPAGKFFHYIGDPKSASGGRVTKGVVRRLGDAGFSRIIDKPQAFGVLAIK
jgi:predicted methyltransferase